MAMNMSKRSGSAMIVIILLVLIAFGVIAGLTIKTVRKNLPIPIGTDKKAVQLTAFDPEIMPQWRVQVIYNNKTNTLSLKNITAVSTGLPDYRGAQFSGYSFDVVDTSGKSLFHRNITISQFRIEHAPASVSIAPLDELTSIFYVPTIEGATKIIIRENDNTKLEIPIRPSALSIVKPVYAQDSKQLERTCGPITAVFLSQHYADTPEDRAAFHKAAERMKSYFSTIEPYRKDFSTTFRFAEAFTTKKLIDLPVTYNDLIEQVGKQADPKATKYILIQKDYPESYGISDGPDTEITVTGPYEGDQVHEFLGHAVGLLWDREDYKGRVDSLVHNKPNLEKLRSNCSNKPEGETFWKQALAPDELQITKNCTATDWYASSTQETANRTTIMAAHGAPYFDKVENYWIEHTVLPSYRSCPSTDGSHEDNGSTCGGWHQACCSADKKCTYEVTTCTSGNTCELCGTTNEPCCNPKYSKGISCINNLQCVAGTCKIP